ncbi:C3HC-type domain-containing protein [Psidium guajava]|nr:C3HC-type domain-containing protein [Psidium guajava]
MAQDSEKRFHSVMDKLFHSPPTTPSSSSPGSQLSRGRKRRPNPASALALLDPISGVVVENEVQISRPPAGSSQTPECRPWDRGDLMRRLSTFKSMTWFAKPKAVSAVNCARRGWVNVDMDIIACEACGARVLFSTPSSWSREQVEKAALVFSLKLDNGHKLLCPWIDNACDESLAQFPPTPPPVLVNQFKQRYISLVQLLALPMMSSSAIKSMTSPQLESFLRDFSLLECGNTSPGLSLAKYTGDGYDQDSAILYYQAIRLISLCGWEPRSLPYTVISKDTNIADSSGRISNKEGTLICIDSTGNNSTAGVNENNRDLKDSLSDPQSVVLECKLCGASVGLWAFSLVPRPLEILRLVGLTELNDGKNSSTNESVQGNHIDIRTNVLDTKSNSETPSDETSSNLNLSIAGGPPPTQQNFKATISLPVIGRNIIARLSSDSDLRSRLYSVQAENQLHLETTTLCEKNKESTEETVRCTSDKQPSLNPDITLTGGIDAQGTSESVTLCSQEVPLVAHAEDSGEEQTCFNVQTNFSSESSCQEGHGDNENGVPAKNELVASTAEKVTKQRPLDEGMQFDPLRQHRHFCPWISTTGGAMPGWQHTLSALHRENDVSNSVTTRSPSSDSFIKVDDPVTSVRRLFTSKRMKSTHGSN